MHLPSCLRTLEYEPGEQSGPVMYRYRNRGAVEGQKMRGLTLPVPGIVKASGWAFFFFFFFLDEVPT